MNFEATSYTSFPSINTTTNATSNMNLRIRFYDQTSSVLVTKYLQSSLPNDVLDKLMYLSNLSSKKNMVQFIEDVLNEWLQTTNIRINVLPVLTAAVLCLLKEKITEVEKNQK